MSLGPVKQLRIPLLLSSWLTFAVALIFYWITTDPGVSYWDCAEYVTTASLMEVGHPPGNPVWMLAMRVATIPFPPEYHAYVINLWSGIFMAFAAFFLCRCIFIPVALFFRYSRSFRFLPPKLRYLPPIAVSAGAALCFALCDSAWFSAVEAEVYAMSAFLTALSLWIISLWWWEKSASSRYRLIILLSYITGVSLGVHQLNLLLIPVFTLIILYKTYKERINPAFTLLCILASCLSIGFILMAFIPGILYGAKSFELFGVNILGLPYDSGVIIFLILALALIIVALIVSSKRNLTKIVQPQTAVWCALFFLLGLSSFGVVMIRAKASPPMNEGTPDNIFSLASYISRDQYPSTPLLYGQTPYSRQMFEETFFNGKPKYNRYILVKGKGVYQPMSPGAELSYRSGLLNHEDSMENLRIMDKGKGYLLSDYKFQQLLTPELNMWFPRLTSRHVNDREAYAGWADANEETMLRIPISETIDSFGNYQPRIDIRGEREPVFSYRPTYTQNLRYFLAYQSYFMYFRYLFWNFIGRQNDFPSMGEIEHGNFITGIAYIDDSLIGDTSEMPDEIWEGNKGRNRYFGIPFIFGIIGMFWLLAGGRKKRRPFSVVMLLFLMTGLAIVVYLNQTPGEPRERDYTFLGSYMAFSMWIAAGFTAMSTLFIKRFPTKPLIWACSLICLAPASLMAAENFDDHDRRHRFEPSFYASSLLDFEIPSIIFSHGDNSSFPLWYASEVLGMGSGHTPVDITYLSLPDYVANLRKQGEKGISTISGSAETDYGKYVLTKIPQDSMSDPLPLTEALEILYRQEDPQPVFPASRVIIPVSETDSLEVNLRDFTHGSSYLSFKHLMLLDILASQISSSSPKPTFFPSLIEYSFYKPLEPALRPTPFGKIYAPWLSDSIMESVNLSAVERELKKLDNIGIKPHYADPVVADRSVRYRGEMIVAANRLLDKKHPEPAIKIVEAIEKNYPYQTLLPGTFTMGDTTFFEGKEYAKLLDRIYHHTGDGSYREKAALMRENMENRRQQWIRYLQTLSPEQRKTLSNRSRRILLK